MKKKRDYTPLTREYFEKAGYDIKLEDREPLMPGLEPWKEWVAYLNRSLDNGDEVYIKGYVTNSMYEGRFVFTGNIGSDLHACVRLYTVNDLVNLYALGHITPDFKPVHDKPYINKDIKVE